jgi:quinol monooxygenase YgiN
MNTPAQSDAYHVVFNCTVKPELVDEFMKIVTTDLVETRKEPGNLRTELMRDRE